MRIVFDVDTAMTSELRILFTLADVDELLDGPSACRFRCTD